MQEPSFWLERIGPRPVRRALSGDLDVDVCVLGAGYTGSTFQYSNSTGVGRPKILTITRT